MIVWTLGSLTIEAEVISGSRDFIGNRVFILRIKLIQGQEFNKVGIYLPAPVFAHGQLYVAFSRGKRFDSIYLEIENTPKQFSDADSNVGRTINVVLNVRN